MPLNRYKTWQWGGYACSVAILVALLSSLAFELTWQPSDHLSIGVHAGQVGAVLYTRGGQPVDDLFGANVGWSPATRSFEFRPGLYGMSRSANYGCVYQIFPLLGAFVVSVLLFVLVPYRRQQYSRLDNGLCVHCGYDLRGTDGEVCNECGRNHGVESTKLKERRKPSVRKALLIFFMTGVLLALFNRIGAWNPWFWGAGFGGPVNQFLGQMCGPLLWVVDLLGPSFGPGVGHDLFCLLAAISVCALWAMFIRRSGLWRRSSLFHMGLAIGWFYGINVVILVVLSIL